MNSSQALKHVDRHDSGPLDEWRGSLERVLERRAVVLARAPLPPDGTDLFECDRDRAALTSLFPSMVAGTAEAVARGAGAVAAAVLCQSRGEGKVLLEEPGSRPREIPAGPARLTPAHWRDGLALACAARDRDALSILSAPGAVAACQLPPERADAFWLPYCRALAGLILEPGAVADEARAALALAEEARIADPAVVSKVDAPLLELARLLAAGRAEGWDDAVARALEAHRAYYSAEENRFDRGGFLAFGILGLCALAHDRGIETRVASPYLPGELVRGARPAALSSTTYLFPERSLARDEEAGWFLDLAGFPRAGCSHRVVEVEGRLVARHEARGAPGLPRARADFVLADGAAPPAVDAGELLWLAQALTSEAGDASHPLSERRALLDEAGACVDAALARIPAGADSVPPETIRSELGRSLLDAEPGRFRRERMGAYREALARSLARLDAGPSDEGDKARASALASIELIRAQVTPILEAIARDRSGEVARMLQPRPEDFERVFVGEAVEVARRAYAAVWEGELDVAHPTARQTELRSFIAPAGMLASENELSREFPGGYRAVARWLNPHRVWVRWRYAEPGQSSGLAYDGLVWCDDHWAWFPKPYRALRGL